MHMHICACGGQGLVLVVSCIAFHLVFGDSLLLLPELTVFNRSIGLPASFQDLPVSMHPSPGVSGVHQA